MAYTPQYIQSIYVNSSFDKNYALSNAPTSIIFADNMNNIWELRITENFAYRLISLAKGKNEAQLSQSSQHFFPKTVTVLKETRN